MLCNLLMVLLLVADQVAQHVGVRAGMRALWPDTALPLFTRLWCLPVHGLQRAFQFEAARFGVLQFGNDVAHFLGLAHLLFQQVAQLAHHVLLVADHRAQMGELAFQLLLARQGAGCLIGFVFLHRFRCGGREGGEQILHLLHDMLTPGLGVPGHSLGIQFQLQKLMARGQHFTRLSLLRSVPGIGPVVRPRRRVGTQHQAGGIQFLAQEIAVGAGLGLGVRRGRRFRHRGCGDCGLLRQRLTQPGDGAGVPAVAHIQIPGQDADQQQ
ncbi:hypothetical protein D6C00_00700 [Thiohalobacter thiocyanaticus]|uniref:Uncharacterized protein n=1 Tax=Thiohalobacter thiocyanaticus TaxID=585455 RepID=A0A426QFX2_9GAMM|nr:hypothetical protein D6C00_00700 [Thiohalobacter thiocyanaticus]